MNKPRTLEEAKSSLDAIDKKYAEFCEQKQQMEAELSRGSVSLDLRGKWVTRLKSLDHSLPKIRKERHSANEIYEEFRREEWLRKQKGPVDILRLRLEAENRQLKRDLEDANKRLTKLQAVNAELMRQINNVPSTMRG